ncbi:diheme cytochrome c [Thiolapillus sp.]
MKPIRLLAMLSLSAITVGIVATAMADDDRSYSGSWGTRALPGVAPVDFPLYQDECGSCHMAYQPGLLPAPSWEKLMSGLDDHFGENAELPENERRVLLNYLLNNAAGRSNYRVSNKLMRNIRGTPIRITELPYFVHEHREIPSRLVTGNPKVRSLSYCDSCHTQANMGSYNEHQINIPGYGRYDD